jgi:sugar-phosphatase
MRPDLDCLAELRIIDEIEFEDCEGITVLPGVEQVLSALSKERFIHAESVTQGKPHPAPYLAGAALLGYKPENCVVFEDAASGVKAGRAAGCTVVATTFSHSVESLNAAHYLIPNMTGVEVEALTGVEGLVLRFTPLAG